jgi:hypothetical protein
MAIILESYFLRLNFSLQNSSRLFLQTRPLGGRLPAPRDTGCVWILMQIKIYLQNQCKELVEFYSQRFIYRLYQLNI